MLPSYGGSEAAVDGVETAIATARKKTKFIVAAHRVAEARRIVADQHELIMTLKASGRPTLEAEQVLQTYLSALSTLRITSAELEKQTKPKRVKPKKDGRFRIRTSGSAN